MNLLILNLNTMKNHTKVYMKYFGYDVCDFIPCEICGAGSVDIHHIQGRGEGKDVPENLVALCRDCHADCHNEKISKEEIRERHDMKMLAGGELF